MNERTNNKTDLKTCTESFKTLFNRVNSPAAKSARWSGCTVGVPPKLRLVTLALPQGYALSW